MNTYYTDKTLPLFNSGDNSNIAGMYKYSTTLHINREHYERDLADRQRIHLEQITNRDWQPCMHDTCPNCLGTGISKFGGMCVHGISWPCPKCTFR